MGMGTIYEPRAFWSVQSLRNDALASSRPALRLTFPRAHFHNGERFNITLEHLLLSPIGYPFEVPTDIVSPDNNSFRAGRGPILERAKLSIATGGRSYLDRRFHALQAYGAEVPTSEPERLDGTYSNGGVTASTASTRLFNVFRWDFSRPLDLPHDGAVAFELGTFGMADEPIITSGNETEVKASLSFVEDCDGFWPAASRQRSGLSVLTAGNSVYQVPGYGNVTNASYGWPGSDNAVLTPDAQMNGTQFVRQQIGGHGAPARLRGFAVALDQLTHDDLGYTVGFGSSTKLASIGDRLNVRARNVAGGSQASWWRPDAPLSLVSPTMTSAKVYRLRKPITLAPGDTLEVRLELPEPGDYSTEYQVGVSFCGFAAIQG